MEKYAGIPRIRLATRLKIADLGLEIEHRFPLKSLPSGAHDPEIIKQGMLSEVEGAYVRIREQNEKYSMTAKYFPKSQEAETEISKEMFYALWPQTFKKQVKTRYKYNNNDSHEWIIDVKEDGSIIAEVELDVKSDSPYYEIPKEFEIIGDSNA